MLAACLLLLLLAPGASVPAAPPAAPAAITTAPALLAALAAYAAAPHAQRPLLLSGTIPLSSPLLLTRAHAGLTLASAPGAPPATLLLRTPAAQVALQGARGVTLARLRIARDAAGAPWHGAPAALSAAASTHLLLTQLAVEGGVRLHGAWHSRLERSTVSNAHGAQNGTCLYVPHCGDAASLTPCNLTLADNAVGECRYSGGGNVYEAAAQGALLGAQSGDASDPALACCVGVTVAHNNFSGIDQMGIRVATDYDCASALNQVVFNKVENWGQLSKARGGDSQDCGCLYQYGHWHAPGNNWTYNYCATRNASWGSNGMYLDDAASGTTVHGNVFFNATAGSAIKLNGGRYNTLTNNLVIGGNSLGFAVCRGLRPPLAYIYTCENNNTGARWLRVLEALNYTQPPWSLAFPFYSDWCSAAGAGPQRAPCAPAGAPPQYECAALPTGNTVALLAGVGMARNDSFAIPTAPGFPFLDPYSHCADFVVSSQFNAVGPQALLGGPLEAYFEDAAGEDWTLRPDAPIFAALPGFQSIPFREIGIRPVPV